MDTQGLVEQAKILNLMRMGAYAVRPIGIKLMEESFRVGIMWRRSAGRFGHGSAVSLRIDYARFI